MEEDFPKDKYYIKKTLANLKNKKNGNYSKTATTVKNTEENLLSMESSLVDHLRVNTEMTHEEAVINTSISRAERNQYIEQQKIFMKQKQEEKQKWE